MPDFEKMYLHLFNGITDALTQLERTNYGIAAEILRTAQQDGEEMYLEDDPEETQAEK